MHPADIQAELKKEHVTQRELAEKLQVSQMSVSRAINRTLVSDRIMRAVSAAIGRDYVEVFPEYYLQPQKRKTSKAVNS